MRKHAATRVDADEAQKRDQPAGVAHEASAIARIGDLLQEATGIAVPESKEGLLVKRVSERLADLGLTSIAAYLRHLQSASGATLGLTSPGSAVQTAPALGELQRLAEAMTIHTTAFFRERAHFEWLEREGIARLLSTGAGRERPLLVWSAACSTGQEAYTCAMVLESAASPLGAPAYRLVGTDLSQPVLKRAATGVYSREEIADIPEQMRRRFLLRSRRGTAERFRIVPEIRAKAEWRQCNLVAGGLGMPRGVDIIFLRNVLIYFDAPTRTRVTASVIETLRPGGIVFSGHSEPLRDASGRLKALAPSVYMKDVAR